MTPPSRTGQADEWPGEWIDGDLTTRYAAPGDIDDYAAMLAKPSVCAHVYFGPNTPEQTAGFFGPTIEAAAAALARGALPEAHVFTVRRTDGRFVGQCALIPVAYGAGNFEIGYQVDDTWWRRGYGTQMGEFVAWYGFRQLRARRLSADTLTGNAGSIRILERLGFRREGVRPGFYARAEQPLDKVLFGVAEPDVAVDLDAIGARLTSPVAG